MTTSDINTDCEVAEQKAQRTDGQYLLGAILLWANINSIIWQQLAAILVIQSGAFAAGFATRKTLTSIGVIGLAGCLTVAIGLQIIRNMKLRGDISDNAHRMVKITIPTPKDGKEFIYMSSAATKQYAVVHGKLGASALLLCLLVMDILVAVTLNFPAYFERLRPTWALPVFGS